MTILTRHDNVGAWPYDSIKWALDVHIKQPDKGEYNYGVLHGNEDAPLRIQLWRKDPNWNTPCDLDWKPEAARVSATPGEGKTLKLSGKMMVIPIEQDITGTQTNDGTVVSDADPGL